MKRQNHLLRKKTRKAPIGIQKDQIVNPRIAKLTRNLLLEVQIMLKQMSTIPQIEVQEGGSSFETKREDTAELDDIDKLDMLIKQYRILTAKIRST